MNKGILIILDGYGEGKRYAYNAVTNANTPFLHGLRKKSYSLLKADSEAVGLLPHTLGGSEVGHGTIGAGRAIYSVPMQIAKDIASNKFGKNKAVATLKKELKKRKSNFHLVGLMSDKNVHSDINHAIAIINEVKDCVPNIFVHFITDGRDTEPNVCKKYLKLFKKQTKQVKNCQIASLGGRFYYMDREGNLDRTTIAFNAMFHPNKPIEQNRVEGYIDQEYAANRFDEFILPVSVKTKPEVELTERDTVMFFNFREDRLRQLAKMVQDTNCHVVTMADVGGIDSLVLYKKEVTKNTLSEYLSNLKLKQIKISESTKYAHITYFLNGGREEPFKFEDRVHVPTIKTNDYAKTPKMRAKEITDEVIKAMDKNYDAILVNYSNPDMIGHTGNYEAVVKALEFLDKCVKKVVENAKQKGYFVCITADHGNADQMRYDNGLPHTSHSFNPVMFTVVADKEYKLKKSGGLKDVAPTFLELLGAPKNPAFEGESLIEK